MDVRCVFPYPKSLGVCLFLWLVCCLVVLTAVCLVAVRLPVLAIVLGVIERV